MPSKNELLDDEQRRAVEAKERAIAILAGPGSGKTRVLSFRARHLLGRDKSSNALMLTFTNKAASEMKSRVIDLTPAMSKRVRAGTFHNFSLSVLRSHGIHVGIEPDFDILDDDAHNDLAGDAAVAAGCRNESSAWTDQRLRQRLPTSDVAKFGAAFEDLKRREGVVDFDDLIVYVAQLFRQKPEIAQAYASKYQHILIDEFQDTNAAQFAIVRALAERASPQSTISVFADDDQAIFGFAGAEAQNINRFCEDLQATIYPLTTNYRCGKPIVTCANRLIGANRSEGRQMQARKEAGHVESKVYGSMQEEARVVCDDIEGRLGRDIPPQEICILVRSASRASEIARVLVERRIPHSNWLGSTYVSREQRQIRTCLSVVRPILPRRMSRMLCELIGVADVDEAINTEEFLNRHASRTGVQGLLEIRVLANRQAPVSEILGAVGKCLAELDPGENRSELLIAEATAFEAHDPDYSLDHLLADLALGGRGGAPTAGGGVKLATIHRTKGLQWPTVYLVGLEADQLPHYHSRTEEQIREERRLCFVAVCRAEDSLTVTRVRERQGYTKFPSRFLAEMGLRS